LVDAKAVAAGDLSALTVAAQRLVAAVRDIRIEGLPAPSGDLR
jgi:hypothetical protein